MSAALSQNRHEGVIGTTGSGLARICLVESGDMVDDAVDDIRADPED